MTITIETIQAAQARLAEHLNPTLLEFAPQLGANVWLKLENTNLTHSFKIRGALNAILSLNDEAKAKGIITASSGNHAQGVAYASKISGVNAQILMPKHTPQRKVNGAIAYGAQAELFGDNFDESEAEALRRAKDDGLTFVSAYNDANVISGAGTIGLEIVSQLPDVERVIVCVSGGGLISGVATAIRALRPNVEIIGVNALSAPHMYNAFYDTHHIENWDTLAEALSGDIEEGALTIPIAKATVDKMVIVTEDEIAEAIRWMVSTQGWLAEGGGVVGIASILSNRIEIDGRPTAVVVSGGNIDASTLMQVMRGA